MTSFLVIQENGRHETNRAFRECFSIQRALNSLGYSVTIWGKGHEEIDVDFDSYDVIINLENYDSGWVPDLSEFRSPFKILWAIDAHFRGMRPYDDEFWRGEYDLKLQASLDWMDENSMWMPNAYDDFLISPKAKDDAHSIGFCGNILDRGEYLDAIRSYCSDRAGRSTFGSEFREDIFVIGENMVNAVKGYGVHFNKNIAEDVNYRSFETIGCGTVLLTNWNKMYDVLGFVDGVNCFMYSGGPQAAVNKYREILVRKDEWFGGGMLEEISKLAKKHTYTERMKSLLHRLEQWGVL